MTGPLVTAHLCVSLNERIVSKLITLAAAIKRVRGFLMTIL